jgi:hypothetical protein
MRRLTKMKQPLSSFLAVLFLVLVTALAAPQAQADVVLTSGNSQVIIDPTSWAGMYSWKVNGAEQMYNQWFWYRVGSTGPESTIDTLSAPGIVTSGTDKVDLTYTGNLMSVLVRYTLTAGSTSAHVAETIQVTNTSASNLSLHFFQYTDFDLNGTPEGDTAQIYAPLHNTVIQSDGTLTVAETVVTPAPSHYQVGFLPDIILSLTDGDPTTLGDIGGPLGPGDLDWAYQWDVDLASGASLIISKDKIVNIVPLPPAAILFGTGLLALVGLRRSRKS